MAFARVADLSPEMLGKYEVLARLSVGGMAELFLGCLPGPGGFRKFVALKQILPDVRRDAEFVKMFLDEARISAALVHPNIGQVFELGEDDSGELYLAMDFIAGQNLSVINRTLAKRGARMPIDIACRVVRDLCVGLHAAHTFVTNTGEAQNIIHRDVSPKNVMLSYSGQVKVIDFGIAKAKGRLIRTQTGVMKGTLSYMAPEQALTKPVDARTDLFAAGVILFELLTGTKMFAGPDPKEAILNGKIVPPSGANADVSPALDAVVMKAVQRDPEKRFQTGRAFAKAITEAYPGLADDEDIAGFLAEHFREQLQTSRELFALAEKNRLPSKSQVLDIVQRLTMVDRAAVATPAGKPVVDAPVRATTKTQESPALKPGDRGVAIVRGRARTDEAVRPTQDAAPALGDVPPGPTKSDPAVKEKEPDDKRTMQLLVAGGLALVVIVIVTAVVTISSFEPDPSLKPPPPMPVAIAMNKPVKDPPRPSTDTAAVLASAKRGQAAMEAEAWVEAEEAWAEVLLLAPNNFPAMVGAGVAAVELKKWTFGLDRLERASSLAAINGSTLDTQTEITAYRARALKELGRTDEARAQLNRLAGVSTKSRRVERVISGLAAELRANTEFPEPAPPSKAKPIPAAKLNEAEGLYREASADKAARNFERAALKGEKCIKIAPSFHPCYRMLGSIYASLATRDQSARDMERAKKYYEQFLQIAPPGDEYVPKVRAILDQTK
ncbi:MAG: serine/threonine protein kinase [Archangium sp.]|nr:serine/threonine protein kinase [Archangium sp.]